MAGRQATMSWAPHSRVSSESNVMSRQATSARSLFFVVYCCLLFSLYNHNVLVINHPASTKLKGCVGWGWGWDKGWGYTGFTLSVCPSICPSVGRIVSALYLPQY